MLPDDESQIFTLYAELICWLICILLIRKTTPPSPLQSSTVCSALHFRLCYSWLAWLVTTQKCEECFLTNKWTLVESCKFHRIHGGVSAPFQHHWGSRVVVARVSRLKSRIFGISSTLLRIFDEKESNLAAVACLVLAGSKTLLFVAGVGGLLFWSDWCWGKLSARIWYVTNVSGLRHVAWERGRSRTWRKTDWGKKWSGNRNMN